MGQKIYFYIILGGIVLISCGRINRTEDIIKIWEVSSIQMINQDTSSIEGYISANPPSKITYEFNSDGTYRIDDSYEVDQGTWLISEDQKVLMLKSETHEADNAEFIIESFQSHKMIISTDESGIREYITLEAQN